MEFNLVEAFVAALSSLRVGEIVNNRLDCKFCGKGAEIDLDDSSNGGRRGKGSDVVDDLKLDTYGTCASWTCKICLERYVAT